MVTIVVCLKITKVMLCTIMEYLLSGYTTCAVVVEILLARRNVNSEVDLYTTLLWLSICNKNFVLLAGTLMVTPTKMLICNSAFHYYLQPRPIQFCISSNARHMASSLTDPNFFCDGRLSIYN